MLLLVLFISFSMDSKMSPNMVNAKIGEYIGISPLTKKQVKPKNNFVADHLLFCNHSESHDDFSIVTREK